MKRLLKNGLRYTSRRWIILLVCLMFFGGITSSLAWLVHAAGSRTLYPNGATGFRANIEWRDSFYGASFLRRRTLLKLYAEAGEFILVGSSAVGVNNGDIRIYDPGVVTETPIGNEIIPANPSFSCEVDQRIGPADPTGRIISRAQELAGPDTIPAGIPGAYVPCVYPAPQTGIYNIVFLGPTGDNSNSETAPTGSIPDDPNNFNAQQDTSVSTWDVTVRKDLTSAIEETGRLFARYLAMFTGNNPRPMDSTLFILTTDGYIYETRLRGLDPNGFIVYANGVGFRDSDGVTPLFRDVVAATNQLDMPEGGVTLAPPSHFIFFELPSPQVIAQVGVPPTPIYPQIASITFNGDLGANNTVVGVGGTFTYTSNTDGIYELIISRDGVDFDPTLPANRLLRGLGSAGVQTVPWDGLDNARNPFPPGTNYLVRVTVRAGEYHFPLLDIENSLSGGPQFMLINPPKPDGSPGTVPDNCPIFGNRLPNCTIAFYDDRGYTTANGADVGTPGQILPGGNNPPPLARSDPIEGFDTSNNPNDRRFGDGSTLGFGDKKGLDLWTYFPSQATNTTVNIFALDLVIYKTDGGISTRPGEVVPYTLVYTNTGSFAASGVIISDTVPANTTFNLGASTPGWSCPDHSPAGTICTISVGTLPANQPGSVIFAVNINNPLPAGVTEILNAAIIGDDGTNGPEPPDNNESTETTPVLPTPDLKITKSNGGVTLAPGNTIVYSLVYENKSSVDATGVVVTENVPDHMTFVGPNIWSCPPGAPAGTICTYNVGTLPANTSGAITIAMRLNDPLPAGITSIRNTTIITDDGSNGPDPTPDDNTDTEDTPVNQPPVPTPYPPDDDDDPPPDSAPPPGYTPPPDATPTATPGVPIPSGPQLEGAAQLTPTLPVLFLPETGTKETQLSTVANALWLLLVLIGIVSIILYLWRKSKTKNVL